MNVSSYSFTRSALAALAIASLLLSLLPFSFAAAVDLPPETTPQEIVIEIPCGEGFTGGFEPDCVPVLPVPCAIGFTGFEPDCVPVPPIVIPEPTQCVIHSDTSVVANPGTTVGVTAHPVWAQELPEGLGEWIWTEPDADGVVTFTKTFNVDDAPTGATLTIAVDNSYTATLNGNPMSCDGSGINNFKPADVDTCSAAVAEGVNTLVITATNAGGPSNPGSGNPAGLNFELVIDGSSCSPVPEPEPVAVIEVCKYNTSEGVEVGWDIVVTNDKAGEDEVTENLTTDEDGCASVEVNPFDGPFFAIEEMKEGWEQVSVNADGGIVIEGQGAEVCEFFGKRIIEIEDVARVAVVDDFVYRCEFTNGPVEVPQCTNLLQNGSFEEPALEGNGWDIFTDVANWVISLSDGLEVWRNFNGNGDDVASDGQQNIEMDGNDATKISQAVTTIPGATYELTFDFSPRAGTSLADNNVDAAADGVVVLNVAQDGSANSTNVWSAQAATFVAADASTDISFEDKGIAQENGGLGALIDNARLCLVREPVTEPEPEDDGGNGGNGKRVELDDEPDRRVEGDSDTREDEPEEENGPGRVLGEQTSVVPAGAPNTGAGGAANASFAGFFLLAAPRRNVTIR